MNKISTKAIVEAGIMATVTFILMTISTFVPGTSLLITCILPIPVILIYLRNSLKAAVLSLLVSGILISLFNNIILMSGTMIITALTSLSLGYCIKYKQSFVKAFGLLTIASLLGNIVDIFLYIKVFLGSTVSEQINLMIESAKSSSESVAKLTGSASSIDFNTLIYMLPAGLVLSMLLSSLLTYIICMKVIRRFNYKMEPIRNFSNWYIDIKVIVVMMIISTIGYLMKLGNITIAKYVILSSSAILQFTMAIIGGAVISYFLKTKYKLKSNTRAIIIIFLFISFMNQFLFIIGLADSIFDLRKIGIVSFNKALKSKK
ncbi:DUF2232 domain-containing protein [Clostridium sp. YIM B02551]|uniref:DUF2232 domain-containing protein n=1 Tax=Clostridium sp. YIM B02551 TaxID=2910679 RepID=UPI001EECDFEE|nr:DUF2232 domain-containing protein [Clostridium sp. YIM B02551]